MARNLRIGVDTGGTFTDVLAIFPDGRLRAVKVPSTPADPAQAFLSALDLLLPPPAEAVPVPIGDELDRSGAVLCAEPSGSLRLSAESSGAIRSTPSMGDKNPIIEVVHGTTVGTNALLERKGGPTALCVTEGFQDLLILGRQARPQIYALHPELAPPLCLDEHCLGVPERLDATGRVLRAPLVTELLQLRDRIAALSVSSVAVVLLHSYASDAHERAVREALAPLGLPVSLSSQVLPAHREYERAMATVIDAYVAPVVGGYLGRLSEALAQRGGRLRVMQSTGGAIPAAEAVAVPARTVLSGPAAGVIGAQSVGVACGVRRIITFDMGGTSTDVSLIDGEPLVTSEAQIAGLPLPLPMLAVHTVGAGGGSLVWVDDGGALQVGPASAGALPGPACYGRGGSQATLTDADLLLGRLSAARFCGGGVPLSTAAAAAAMDGVARRLGLSALLSAAGVVQVTTALLARAVRAISVERGQDPGEFVLVPFGGAGALHAADLAQELGITQILVPPAPGLLSAYGALCARGVHERARTLLSEASGAQESGAVSTALRALRAQVEEDIERAGGASSSAQFSWTAELRYRGQSYELSIPGLGDGGPAQNASSDLVVRFCEEHRRRYGFTLAEQSVDLVVLRIRGELPVSPLSSAALGRLGRRAGAVQLGIATQSFLEGGRMREMATPVLDRAALLPEQTFLGPALIVEYSATTVVPPGWRATSDEYGALRLSA